MNVLTLRQSGNSPVIPTLINKDIPKNPVCMAQSVVSAAAWQNNYSFDLKRVVTTVVIKVNHITPEINN